LEEGGKEGSPSEVIIFAGWRKGAQMSGVRGSGVEGGLRAVPGGRVAKKRRKKTQPQQRFLFAPGGKLKKAEKGLFRVLFVYP